jgi:hypothetical protein
MIATFERVLKLAFEEEKQLAETCITQKTSLTESELDQTKGAESKK